MKLVVNTAALTAAEISAAQSRQLGEPGPPFTSYPAADRFTQAFGPELGLVRVNSQAIEVTDNGWFCIRAIAMVFDRYLPPADARSHFLRVV